MLSFAEKIYLLVLGGDSKKVSSYNETMNLGYVLIGAVLCELSILNKIDTDLENLYVIDATPTQNRILDSILSVLASKKENMPALYWLKLLLGFADKTESLVLELLLEKKILGKLDEQIFGIMHTSHYSIENNNEIENVKQRLRRLILSNEIPDPSDAVLISFVRVCNLFDTILSVEEKRRTKQRIETISKLDLVGRELINMINKDYSQTILQVNPRKSDQSKTKRKKAIVDKSQARKKSKAKK